MATFTRTSGRSTITGAHVVREYCFIKGAEHESTDTHFG